MNGANPAISLRSVGYALLTQAVWVPLVVVDHLDTAHTRKLTIQERAKGGVARIPSSQPLPAPWRTGFRLPQTGVMLNQPLAIAQSSVDPLIQKPVTASVDDSPKVEQRQPLFRPYVPGGSTVAQASTVARRPAAADPITRAYTRAELLGGTLALDGLHSPLVPPLALAEQARYRASGDPLSPVPKSLRAPMRQAIQQLQPTGGTKVQQARVTHVPSARVKTATQVPVAIQGDGSVDILSQPDSPAVVEEIRDWSKRQAPSARNTVTPAVVHIHPIPEASVRPSALPADASPAARGPAPAPEPSWTPVTTTEVSVVTPASVPVPPDPAIATPDQVLP
ncbi:MAG: hypothetical protein VKN13_07045 [Cyanobacteriota bacterium]|nr:hypothetical protein [Cyanobacteriota bacterium]